MSILHYNWTSLSVLTVISENIWGLQICLEWFFLFLHNKNSMGSCVSPLSLLIQNRAKADGKFTTPESQGSR